MTEIAPRIAAIICTHNRASQLAPCLQALADLAEPVGGAEIIVVDNASDDDTPAILKQAKAANPRLRIVTEPTLGLAHARNAGLAATNAPLIAFTDDDATPEPDWLCRICDLFDQMPETVAGLGGEIEPVWPQDPPEWLTIDMLRLLSARLGWSLSPRYLKPGEWICEANCTYRRDRLVQYGGFPTQLGRIGTSLLSGENAINQRMEQDGQRFYFDPTLRVRHHIAAERLSKAWLRKRMFWQGVTSYLVDEYLSEGAALAVNDLPVPQPRHLTLPCAPEAWANTFSDTQTGSFAEVLPDLWSLGYTLASQGLVGGR